MFDLEFEEVSSSGRLKDGTQKLNVERGRSSWGSLKSQLLPVVRNVGSSWVDSGRALASRMQSMVLDEHHMSGAMSGSSLLIKPPGLDSDSDSHKIFNSVMTAFERQEDINKVNSQLTKLNYMVNVANFVKHKQIETIVQRGQQELCKMNQRIHFQSQEIDSLNSSIDDMSLEIDQQKDVTDRLSTSLTSQERLLKDTIVDHRRELERHNSLLVQQETAIKNLMLQRMRRDFMVDASCVAVAVYLSNTFLVNFPLTQLLHVVPLPSDKSRKWTRQFVKLLLVLKIVMLFRSWSIKCGLHNSIGSVVPYSQQMVHYITGRLRTLGSRVMNGPISEQCDVKRPESPLVNVC